MWSRRLLILLLGLAAGWIDVGVSTWLPGEWMGIRTSLALVLMLAMFSSRERAVTAAVAAGLVLDVLLPSFSLMTLRLLLLSVAVHALSSRFFTSRSLLGASALALTGLAIDRVMIAIITSLRELGRSSFIPDVQAAVWAEGLWLLISVGVTFLIFASFTKRFFPSVTRR